MLVTLGIFFPNMAALKSKGKNDLHHSGCNIQFHAIVMRQLSYPIHSQGLKTFHFHNRFALCACTCIHSNTVKQVVTALRLVNYEIRLPEQARIVAIFQTCGEFLIQLCLVPITFQEWDNFVHFVNMYSIDK